MYLSSTLRMNSFIVCLFFSILFQIFGAKGEETSTIDSCQKDFKAEKGSFSVPTENNCDEYIYVIDSFKTSSIISISTQENNFKDYLSNKETSQISEDRSIVVIFKENTTLDSGEKSLIAINVWTITSQNIGGEHIYFSRTSQLHISITIKGNWSENNAFRFFSEEVPFREYKRSSEDAGGEIKPWEYIKGREYRPNSAFHFQINGGNKVNSINLALKKLDIDEAIGEYLLIGSGTNPFEGPPPLFISNKPLKDKYKIFDENAYVVCVSSSTRSPRKGFIIEWEHDGTKTPDDDGNEHFREDDILQSVQVCIYNKSAALAEFNKTQRFMKFREEISEIASKYAKENKPRSEYTIIQPSQVEIFRVSDVIREDETDETLKAGGFYVMVKVRGPEIGTAAFRWYELENIIDDYYNLNHSKVINGYKIASCPNRHHLPSKWTSVGFFAIIPILCCLFLVIWAWRHSRFSDVLSEKVKGAAIQLRDSQSMADVHVENVYTNAVPEIRITHDQGRRYTLTQNELLGRSADEDSENEVYNRNNFRRQSFIHEAMIARNSARLLQNGEINAAFVGDEECCGGLQRTDQLLETELIETEHVYDTVKSEKSSKKGTTEEETKL